MSRTGAAISLALHLPDLPAALPSHAVTTGLPGKPKLSASELLLDYLPDALEVLGICAVTRNLF
ncbi:MAG TPA: hypothetical protein VHJ18_08360 [Streptosporangiaceae bacterium]|jgi:hypothetical protein|nr:hypothetical protein [Streptosporangiaceae bacterium]